MTSLPVADRLYRLAPIELAGQPSRGRWRQLRRLRLTWLGALCGTLVLAGAATVSALSLDADYGMALAGVARSIALELARLRWQFAAIVLLLAGLHYLASALAARTASGLPLPVLESVLVQFAAAAANRLTPAGLGSSAVNARYFTRRGLEPAAALGSVAMLSAVGPITDVLLLGLVVLAGSWIGLGGAGGELGRLSTKLHGAIRLLHSPWTWSVLVLLALGVLLARRNRKARSGWRGFWQPAQRLVANPKALLTLILASGSTTLIMALAFAASIAMVPGPHPQVAVGAIVALFMVGSAAGSAVPVPAGLGSTEAALTAVLVGIGIPADNAMAQVLTFRLLTFWLPALVGVLATRRLRGQAAL
ncbi:MAG: YbhN family protein [Jatrophihabitantaceae bacterium]